jgi:hypothetical protein
MPHGEGRSGDDRPVMTRPSLAIIGRHLATFDWSRLSLMCALLIGLIFGVEQATGLIVLPYDFHNYWQATDFGNLYAADWSDPTYAYVYTPVLAQVLYPFHVLPAGVVLVGWTLPSGMDADRNCPRLCRHDDPCR